MSQKIPPLAVSIVDAAAMMGVSRATFYRELSAGRISARKSGKRTLVLVEEIQRWLDNLPTSNVA